ncbi:hypothetical protein AVEN_34501-1 [Araneus ventricosus]|uniref:Uncharacterized protein n=1 Tax=Araneus ventricosus TaxID=182803 RepID=A0A4Y2MRH1_ARAVE|nr:hypothetical protein AVEN_34501-1 [Araneus ventricosus]
MALLSKRNKTWKSEGLLSYIGIFHHSPLLQLFCICNILIVEVLWKLWEVLKALGSIYHPSCAIRIHWVAGCSPATVELQHGVNSEKLLHLVEELLC